jgi:hypothetical protein
MITLTPHECRVLGTLIEKAQTTPGQYPLTLNGLTTGCNQKNNRDPVTSLTEDAVLDALEGLRGKSLVREAMLAGSRVHKFRHVAREALGVSTAELVVLAELMLRGPQAPGELRSNAGRMMPPGDEGLATLDATTAVLEGLRAKAEPMVRRFERRTGERAERWGQLLCAELHPLGSTEAEHVDSDRRAPSELESRVARLEAEVESLKAQIHRVSGA